VSISYGSFGPGAALTLAAEYPGVGSVRQVARIEDIAATPPAGSLSFAADSLEGSAYVEVDLAGQVVAMWGDEAVVNEQLEPFLAASAAWRDAHALTFALADLPPPPLDMTLSVAVPSRRGDVIKRSIIGQTIACAIMGCID
jgi:hypothetical protein